MYRHLSISRLALLLGLTWGLCGGPRSVVAAIAFDSPDNCNTQFQIGFDTLGQTNPSFTFTDVPVHGQMTVSFGSLFQGQALGPDPNTLSDKTPTAPLQLDLSGPPAITQMDLASPNSPVLGTNIGSSFFTGPLAMHFDNSVSHVCFDLGHVDMAGTTLIEAFDRQANSLGAVANPSGGIQRISLQESSGQNLIAGLSIYAAPGQMDWEGFAIDNVSFGVSDGGNGVIPEPGAVVVWSLLGLSGLGAVWARRRQSADHDVA